MFFVGQKTYFTANENLVVSISRLTPGWSRFQYQPGTVFLQTAQLADLVGEVALIDERPFKRYEGTEAAEVLRKLQTWLGFGFNRDEYPDWLVGRRLVAGWKPTEMVAFEGLQVPPSKYGLGGPGISAVLYELWEFDGVLIEMHPQKLSGVPEGTIPKIACETQNWLLDENVEDSVRQLSPPAM